MRPLNSATRNSLLLFLGCIIFHVLGTWTLPLIDRDEPRFAEASREMLQRGDYVVPYFNNAYRFDKPPLTYWFQVASYRVFGDNDFAARFPSTVAAALTAVLLLIWGKRLGGDQLGWAAALVFSLSLQTFIHAKAAVADMWLVFFVTAAHWAAFKLLFPAGIDRRRWIAWITLYGALALAFLAKGPIGWTPLITLAAMKFARRDISLRNLGMLTGIPFTLALVCAWGIPALIQTHGEFWRVGIGHHVIDRSVATMEGHGAASPLAYLALLPFYFVTVFASFFPWSTKLPALVKSVWRNRDATDAYLIAGVLAIFFTFTLVRTKLPHYTLPALPLLSLLLARHVRFEFIKRVALFATIAMILVALLLPPIAAKQFPALSLFRSAQSDLLPQTELATVEFTEPSLVWYFRQCLAGYVKIIRPREAEAFLQQPGPRALCIPTGLVQERLPTLDPAWKVYTTHGINIAKGKAVDLSLIIKQP